LEADGLEAGGGERGGVGVAQPLLLFAGQEFCFEGGRGAEIGPELFVFFRNVSFVIAGEPLLAVTGAPHSPQKT